MTLGVAKVTEESPSVEIMQGKPVSTEPVEGSGVSSVEQKNVAAPGPRERPVAASLNEDCR